MDLWCQSECVLTRTLSLFLLTVFPAYVKKGNFVLVWSEWETGVNTLWTLSDLFLWTFSYLISVTWQCYIRVVCLSLNYFDDFKTHFYNDVWQHGGLQKPGYHRRAPVCGQWNNKWISILVCHLNLKVAVIVLLHLMRLWVCVCVYLLLVFATCCIYCSPSQQDTTGWSWERERKGDGWDVRERVRQTKSSEGYGRDIPSWSVK